MANQSDTEQKVASSSEPTLAQPSPPAPAPPAPGSSLLTGTGDNSGHAASPTPPGVRDVREDAERSWQRPRPLETKEAVSPPPSAPAGGLNEPPWTEPPDVANPPPASVVVEDDPAAAPPEPPAFPPPAAPDSERMSLREQPTTQPADTAGVVGDRRSEPAPASPEKTTIHVIQAGDTYSHLAAKYLGHARYANLIEKVNPKLNPNRLYVGTKLKIPAAPPAVAVADGGAPAPAGAQRPRFTPPPVDPAKAYTIKAGDSWSGLAREYLGDGNAWTMLYEHNKERFPGNSRMLRPGMVIEIPLKDQATPKK